MKMSLLILACPVYGVMYASRSNVTSGSLSTSISGCQIDRFHQSRQSQLLVVTVGLRFARDVAETG